MNTKQIPSILKKQDVKIQEFLIEIDEVCKKHGLSISHEDRHGSFLITNYNHKLRDWLCKVLNRIKHPIQQPKVANKPYTSDRGIPLLWQGQVDVPIITAEWSEKWYDLYIVYPNKSVEKVSSYLLKILTDKEKYSTRIDHDFHPLLLIRAAEHLKGEVDPIALEVAAGRWGKKDILNSLL